MEIAWSAASSLPRPDDPQQSGDRDFAFAAVASAQARAGLIDSALETVRQIVVPSRRAEPLMAIAEAQGRRGQIDQGFATAQMFAEGQNRARPLVPVAGALARALRMQEAFATAQATRPDPVAHVMALSLIGEAQYRAGNLVAAAEETFVQALTAARSIAEHYPRVIALCAIAQAKERSGERAAAAAVFAEAQATASELTEPSPADTVLFYLAAGSRGSALANITEAQAKDGSVSDAEATSRAIPARNFDRIRAFQKVIERHIDRGDIHGATAAMDRLGGNFRWNVLPTVAGGLARAGQVHEAVAALDSIPESHTEERLRALVEIAMGTAHAERVAGAGSLRPPLEQRGAQLTTVTAPVLTEPARGMAHVLSTAVLLVGNINGGRAVTLAHIEGLDGAHARGIAAFITSRGGTVVCEPIPPAVGMLCRTEDGVDLGAAALFNGGARTKADAPPNYRSAELAARQARRGIWAE